MSFSLYRVFPNSVHELQDIVPLVKRNIKHQITKGLLSFVHIWLYVCVFTKKTFKLILKKDYIIKFSMKVYRTKFIWRQNL